LSAFKKSPAATTTSSQNQLWSVIEEEQTPSPVRPASSTIQYDHDDNDTKKLYYSVYDDDDDDDADGEDDDNDYEYEDYEEDDDDTMMNMIEYNMTYTEADDDARFDKVTTNAETRTRSHKKSAQVGKYRQ